MATEVAFTERLREAIKDVYLPEIMAELDLALKENLAIARQRLDREIRQIMDTAIESIKNLVTVRLSPFRSAGVDISINYPLPEEKKP